MKFLYRSLDWIMSAFSQPLGRPNSTAGKLSLTNWIVRPVACAWLMNPAILVAFTGVVMKLTWAPCSASRRAMSVMGIVWPCAISGTSTKCFLSEASWLSVSAWPAEAMAGRW